MRLARLMQLPAFLLLLPACEHEAAGAREGPSVAPEAAAVGAAASGDAAGLTPVLVELYTSQGCSSCPPAEQLLRELVREPPQGVLVVPLAFHVDYWDDLGWPDPFADPRWTERQLAHESASGSTRIYTPQVLIDGRDHRVGTRRARTEAALRAASTPALELGLEASREGRTLRVVVDLRWREGAERSKVAIMVAVTDGGHHTAIPAGENAGLTLDGEFVVRDLAQACTWSEQTEPRDDCSAELSLAEVDRPDQLRIVAFAQEPDTWRVRGVAMR